MSEQAINGYSNGYSIAHCCVTSFVLYAIVRQKSLHTLKSELEHSRLALYLVHPCKVKCLLKWNHIDIHNKQLSLIINDGVV